MILSLSGFMGCGKSTVGRIVGRMTGAELIDLDSYIETAAGKSIPEIFEADGEAGFRMKELEALRDICGGAADADDDYLADDDAEDAADANAGDAFLADANTATPIILSLGGGTLTTPECAKIIRENTFCIYLRAKAETLVENLRNETEGRPMLKGDKSLEQKASELLAARAAIYEGTAHLILDTDGISPEQIAEDIVARL